MNDALAYDLSFNLQILLPMLLALLCGAVVGAERTRSGRAAGVRTYALVCFSCASVMALTNHPSLLHAPVAVGAGVRTVDPTRVIQGVLSGIGFLGAGVIFRHGFNVRGLTTASAIWAVAVVGILIGMGFIVAGALTTALIVTVLALSSSVENVVAKTRFTRSVVTVDRAVLNREALIAVCEAANFKVVETFYKKAKADAGFEYTFVLRTNVEHAEERLAQALEEQVGVLKFTLAPNEG